MQMNNMKHSIHILFFVIGFFVLQQFVENKQDKYKFETEYGELIYFNKDLVNAQLKFFKANRSVVAANLTGEAYVAIDNTCTIRVELHPLKNNEYKRGPIDFTVPFCAVLEKKEMMEGYLDTSAFLRDTNATGCPLLPGFYYVNNIIPDASNFPPLVPGGRYKIILTFNRESVMLAQVNWFVKISYGF